MIIDRFAIVLKRINTVIFSSFDNSGNCNSFLRGSVDPVTDFNYCSWSFTVVVNVVWSYDL